MNVRELLEDASQLWMLNRKESAFLLVLVAVAATARKRYPRPISDGDAFKRFIVDQSETITGVEFDIRLPLPVPSKDKPIWIPLSEILYKYLRCHIIHEAEMPPRIRFVDAVGNMMIIIHGDPLEIPDGFVGSLALTVQEAPENKELFDGTRIWVRPSEALR